LQEQGDPFEWRSFALGHLITQVFDRTVTGSASARHLRSVHVHDLSTSSMPIVLARKPGTTGSVLIRNV
jgi:hypothetical protein